MRPTEKSSSYNYEAPDTPGKYILRNDCFCGSFSRPSIVFFGMTTLHHLPEIVCEYWQNRDFETLETLLSQHAAHPDFVDVLLHSCLDSTDLQAPSTWLLKRYLESKYTLAPAQVTRFCSAVPHLDSWETRLHALQILPRLPLSPEDVAFVIEFVRGQCASPRSFVQAWAVFAMAFLAKTDHNLVQEAVFYAREALENGSASVRVRARKALELLDQTI